MMLRLQVYRARKVGPAVWWGKIIQDHGEDGFTVVKTIAAPTQECAIEWGCSWLHLAHTGTWRYQ